MQESNATNTASPAPSPARFRDLSVGQSFTVGYGLNRTYTKLSETTYAVVGDAPRDAEGDGVMDCLVIPQVPSPNTSQVSVPFTPGPWRLTFTDQKFGSVSDDGMPLVRRSWMVYDTDPKTLGHIASINSFHSEGDARLIAAAPELYAACGMSLGWLKAFYTYSGVKGGSLRSTIEAVEKALSAVSLINKDEVQK